MLAMGKDLFITDERLSFSKLLASTSQACGYNVLLTSEDNTEKTIQWNRNTPFALQHLSVQLKNRNMQLETAILVFDAVEYAKLFSSSTLISIDKTCTELILAYANLSLILQAIMIKQETGRLIFVMRPDENAFSENFAVNMAKSAFVQLAEDSSRILFSKKISNLQSLLVKLENSDKASASWLVSQLELANISRNGSRWVKAGTRGFFS